MDTEQITILGVGCTLLADQGFGVGMIQSLNQRFEFPDHVHLVDGGLVGVGLTGIIAQADQLIVIDAIANGGRPGDIYRLEGRGPDAERSYRRAIELDPTYKSQVQAITY